MDANVLNALHTDRVVDITTTGRKSGQPRRIEIALIYVDDETYVLSGGPGPRSWHANLLANPELTVHVKKSAQADLKARATEVTDEAARRDLVARMSKWDVKRADIDQEAWVKAAPLMKVEVLR
jgi:deazaflavin-dependent oxidoreductase (nitroreductase family)